MKYTGQLLKKFISVNDSPENIAKNLILKTCEIEEIHQRTISENIVIGYVKSCEQHPDADKLKVCSVDCGKKGEYTICCGGSNVAAGLYVPVALPGTVFEKLGITIEPRKMRGIESNGMICSKEEIDILEDMEKHSIWSMTEDLDDISDADLGTAVKDKFPRLESRVMEVDNKSITNRPDLTGHFGAAIELNAIYSKEPGAISFNKIKEYYEQCTPEYSMQILENSTKPERKVIGETEKLNAYLLLHIKNITVKQASFLSRLQTLDLGSNPINNWVDFSNLFMNISGQPVHFFDAEKVDGDIVVRNAKNGEKFTDLFQAEHILKDTDIVIADQKKILALAGVVGGLDSGITETTKNILVEIANFDAVAVRKTGTRLGLRTDAELRFEKNINPRYTLFCLILFLDELHYYKKDLGDFEMGGLSYYIANEVKGKKEKEIEVDIKAMEQFIFGQKIKGFDKKAEKILTDLGFAYTADKVTPPLRRGPDDLNIPEDIYEEVARIYGYDQIENLPLLSKVAYTPYSEYVAIQRKIEDILVRNIGCNQVETYPWISEKASKELGGDTEILYKLQNPINPETPYMRDSMMYGLLAYTAKNSKFFEHFSLFDIGKIWDKKETGTPQHVTGQVSNKEQGTSKFASGFVQERTQLGIRMYEKTISQWCKDPILQAKQLVKTIAKELELGKITFEKTSKETFHPKKQAVIKNGETVIGFMGALHPFILQNNKIGEASGTVYISLDITTIIEQEKTTVDHIYTYESLQDQIIWRDLCFVVDASKDFEEIITAVKQVPEVKEVEVFDVYVGKNLGDDKKSVSIQIKIVGDGSMTTEQINEVMNKAIKAGEAAGGSLRA